MKKIPSSLLLLLAATLLFSSCTKQFDEYIKNPNRAESVPPNLLLNGILYDMNTAPFGNEERWDQFTCANYVYYDNNRYDWTGASLNYSDLENVIRMEKEAVKLGENTLNPYEALGKFFRAYFFVRMTLKVGDLPMTQALQGQAGFTPKYDTQKDIFIQCFKWLDSANTDLGKLIAAGDHNLQGDFYYHNDLAKWQKAVNTFRLRVLIELSKKASDPDLNVPGQFAMIMTVKSAQYPVFQSMEDNLQFQYNNTFNKYPNNPDIFGFDALRYNMAATYLNTLAALHDPRTYLVAEPARHLAADSGYALTDFRAFVGASSGQDLGTMYDLAQQGYISLIGRKRYWSGYLAEPTFIVSYPEMCFNIAEAVNRGWIGGDAESWYKKGIQAMIGFYGIQNGQNTVYFLKPGGSVSNSGDYESYSINFDFNTYYNQSAVSYAGNTPQGLGQILTQKYLAFFRNSGLEAYYNYRRTGIPNFLTGPGTGNSGRIPRRFQYPIDEASTNAANYQAALQSQYGGKDDINQDMWIMK